MSISPFLGPLDGLRPQSRTVRLGQFHMPDHTALPTFRRALPPAHTALPPAHTAYHIQSLLHIATPDSSRHRPCSGKEGGVGHFP